MPTDIETPPTIFVHHYSIEPGEDSDLCNIQFDIVTVDKMCSTSYAIAALKSLLDQPKLTIDTKLISASHRGEDGQLVHHLIR